MRTGSPLLGTALGLILLAGLVGFAVGLSGDDQDPDTSALPADPLPAELRDGALVSYERLEPIPGAEVSPEQLADAMGQQVAYAEGRLTDVFEREVALATYAAPDFSAQAEVTVYAGEPGLFKPGLPSDPEGEHASAWFDAVRYGEVRCFVAWASDDQTATAGGVPAAVQCQRGDAGRTYDIRTSGMGAEATAAALNEVVAHVADQGASS